MNLRGSWTLAVRLLRLGILGRPGDDGVVALVLRCRGPSSAGIAAVPILVVGILHAAHAAPCLGDQRQVVEVLIDYLTVINGYARTIGGLPHGVVCVLSVL